MQEALLAVVRMLNPFTRTSASRCGRNSKAKAVSGRNAPWPVADEKAMVEDSHAGRGAG